MSGTIALSIPGLFLTCVKYFELIQVGRNFDNEFASCVLQMRGTELRLRRWGQAAGITDSTSPSLMGALQGYQEDEVVFVRDALKQIEVQLEDARRLSKPLVGRRSDLAAAGTETDHLNETHHTEEASYGTKLDKVLSKFRSQYGKTLQFGDGLNKKTKWALYDSTALNDLIGKISTHVSDLEKLFTKDIERLTVTEAGEIAQLPSEALPPLLKVTGGVDPLLQEALKTQVALSGRTFEGIEADGEARLHIGTSYKHDPKEGKQGDTFRDMKFGGKSVSHVGDNVGYDQK